MPKPTPPKTVLIPFQVSVRELADRSGRSAPEIIGKLLENRIVATINETIDFETASLIVEDFGLTAQLEETVGNKNALALEDLEEILRLEKEGASNKLSPRPPIVTILGHVDHGKTTLLDTLRKTKVAEGESGGITQHIRAYQVEQKDQLISFIDTPGHEAFQSMRQRGASIADIAVLVVAADDGVKPQTKEVASFLIEKRIPTVVAINKIDKPEANINRVKQELAEIGILLEGYGGEIPFSEISAKNNLGLDELLDTILLVSEVHNFQANSQRDALGIVLEAHKDPQTGPVATVLVKTGTLKLGQEVQAGSISGKVRKLEDYRGKNLRQAGPSMPLTLIGLSDVPSANDVLYVPTTEKRKRRRSEITSPQCTIPKATLSGQSASDEILSNIDQAMMKHFPIILKADVQGSLEAVHQILETIQSDEVCLDIIREGVGPITETDIQLAQTSGAKIYGFSVFPTSVAKRMAEERTVTVKSFGVIYELVEEVHLEMSELLDPEIKRTDLGKLKVLAIFKNMKKGMVVGGKVTSGELVKGENLELVRDKEILGKGKLTQLQHNKEDVSKVKSGLECGITFESKEKIQIGDTLICYKEEALKRRI